MTRQTAYDYFIRGLDLLGRHHPAQAAVLLEKAKTLEPSKGSIREALGRSYFNYGQWEQASQEFGRALEIDPTNHYAHFGLALSLDKLGEPVRALGHLRLALAMEPGSDDYSAALERLAGQT